MDFFEKAYQERPPWDIGRPQQEIVRLEQTGQITGTVLDVGCGTGDNALFLASCGHEVVGLDSVERAIEAARRKADERSLSATFIRGEILSLREIGRTFDTVIDSGLFHTLSDNERLLFVRNLHKVLVPGGSYFMLAFSNLEPAGYGPRRITKQEIHDLFSDGWRVNGIQAAVFESRTRKEGSRAWLSSITRL
ncbi:MAG TPA: class I SAM-dependent methyltransferase [Methanoregulaceae archaeon]|jgi:2-polyprenyl-3-methyl-5-hydroxy-6-metoxy-1,4-benzoquinol methylase|nr:class I SAM-dependent methyltransferase [Methanoregulaceae archaeon]HPW10075.1 class I SAM-dependent methyltransferase [Methanoregulaceae archaeon]